MKKFVTILFFIMLQTCFSQWEPCNNGLWGGAITALALDSNNFYAGTNTGEIYLSTDFGENWTKKVETQKNKTEYSKINSISVKGKRIVATYKDGISTSNDYGNSWINNYSKDFDHYKGTHTTLKGDSIYMIRDSTLQLSVDFGSTWKMADGLTFVRSIAVNGNTIYAVYKNNVYISKNGGETWDLDVLPNADFIAYSISTEGSFITIAGSNGNYFSLDSGKTWNVGNCTQIGSYPSVEVINDGIVYAFDSFKNIFVSSDSLKSWTKIAMAWYYELTHSSFVFTKGNIFVGTLSKGVIHTTDQGKTWIQKNNGFINVDITYLSADASGVLAGSGDFGTYGSIDNGNKWGLINSIFSSISISGSNIWVGGRLSTDNGQNWSKKRDLYVNSISSQGNNVWICYESKIDLSTDNGDTWTNKTEFYEAKSMSCYGSILLVARTLNEGAAVTLDNGYSWRSSSGIPYIKSVSTAIFREHLAVGSENGVYISSDYGKFWEPKNSGLLNKAVSSLAAIRVNLFAGTAGGVFLTVDNGESWKDYNSGLPSLKVLALAIGKEYLYASIEYYGVYRIKLEGLISVEEEAILQDETSELIGYYTILGEKLQNIDNYHGLLLKVQMKDGKMVAEKVVVELSQ